MNWLKNKIVSNKATLMFSSLLFVGILLTWYRIINLTITGDGYVYLTHKYQQDFFQNPLFFTDFQTAAVFFGVVFERLFSVFMPAYYVVELILMVAINFIFFLLIYKLTKNRLAAFTGAIIALSSYFGNWDMYTDHCYCFFLERIILVPLLLLSFLFLHLFLINKKNKFLFFSSIFFLLGVGLNHFGILFSAPFFFYPVFWNLFFFRKRREIINGVGISILFLSFCMTIVLAQRFTYNGGPIIPFLHFTLHPQKYRYIEQIFLQLTYWSNYYNLVLHFNSPSPYALIGDKQEIKSILPFVTVIYGIASIVIYKKLSKFRALLLTLIFSTFSLLYINVWFGEYLIFNQTDSSRYLYFPTFFLAIFWSLFFLAIFWRSKKTIILGILILISFFYINERLIADSFDLQAQWNGQKIHDMYYHAISMRTRLRRKTVVLVPNKLMDVWEGTFLTEQIGRGSVVYMQQENSDQNNTWQKVASRSAAVVLLSYDDACQCVKEKTIK